MAHNGVLLQPRYAVRARCIVAKSKSPRASKDSTEMHPNQGTPNKRHADPPKACQAAEYLCLKVMEIDPQSRGAGIWLPVSSSRKDPITRSSAHCHYVSWVSERVIFES